MIDYSETRCDFELPLDVVVNNFDSKDALTELKLMNHIKNLFKWKNFKSRGIYFANITITSCDYKLIDLKKQLREQGIAIFPLENGETTILLKTEPISSHDLWEKITDDKKGYPHIAFLHSIDNNEESSEAWEVTVKPGEIQKFINAEHDDSIQIVIPYSVSATRFDVCTVPPSVIVEEAGFFITAALRENATITNFSDGKLRILFSNYKSFRNEFHDGSKIAALGIPFDVFFSSKRKTIIESIRFKFYNFIEDDIFYTTQNRIIRQVKLIRLSKKFPMPSKLSPYSYDIPKKNKIPRKKAPRKYQHDI